MYLLSIILTGPKKKKKIFKTTHLKTRKNYWNCLIIIGGLGKIGNS